MQEHATHEIRLQTACGALRGVDTGRCAMYLGVPFAKAERFSYAVPVDSWEGELDATHFGPGCPQNRAVYEHLEHPTRRFYKKEFRQTLEADYSEDCLNLNIYAPYGAENAPVILFYYGGGFDSGLNAEDTFDGEAMAELGVITVFANYRVGPLGYLTHAEVQKRFGRDGNFGLDDQLQALHWVRRHIADFGGDADNLTLMGQSAGAISVQFLCINPAHRGLFRRAVMLSGAGKFPDFALPRLPERTRDYWEQFIRVAGCEDFDALQRAPLQVLYDTVEKMKDLRDDTTYCTMPVVDGVLIPKPVGELIRDPLPLDYMIGYTNADMFAPIMAWIGNRFGRQTDAYIYFFDRNAPGDDNRAFHSADLRYMLGTLHKSWRPYTLRDRVAEKELTAYIANFARCGDPNGDGLPLWEPAGGGLRTRVLRIGERKTAMGHAAYGKMIRNFLRRKDPEA